MSGEGDNGDGAGNGRRAEGEGIIIKHSHKVLELADGVLKAEDMLADKEVNFQPIM